MTELQLFSSPLDALPFQVAIGATARTVATEFSVTSGNWWLSEMRLWRSSWELVGPLQFRVYTVINAASGTLLTGSDATLKTRGLGWQVARLAAPVKLTTGQVYRVCCWAPRGVNYETGFWSSAVTNGALTAPNRATSVGVTQGAYIVGTSLSYPTTDGNSTNWWVDVTVTDVDPATTVTAPLTAALAAAEHTPLVVLRADWNRDGYAHALADVSRVVSEVTVNRSVTGDLPVEAGLVEGYAAAQLTATLHSTITEETAPTGPGTGPSFVAEYESAWTNTTSPKTVSVTTAVGDQLVVIGVTSDSTTTLNAPTGGTGLAWVLKTSVVSALRCSVFIWTSSRATTAETFTLSVTQNGATDWFWGFNCLRWSGSAGIGPNPASATGPSSAPSLDITTAGKDSAVVVVNADWNVGTGARTWRTTAGALSEVTYSTSSGQYTVYGGYHANVGAAGVKNVGLTAPVAQAYSIAAVEVLGISGDAVPATDAFDALAPYRTDSPLAAMTLVGAPVTCDLGLATDSGPVVVRQFTGRIRSVRADSATRQVTLSALDPAEQLRASITLPTYGMRRIDLPYLAKPQAVIDCALRANGIYASPPAFPDAQISCTGHGWLAAEVGATALASGGTVTISDPPFWVPGPFDMLAVRGNWSSPLAEPFYAKDQNYAPDQDYGIGVCAWVRVGNNLGQTAANYGTLVQLLPMVGGGPSLEVRIYGDGRLGAYIGSNGSIRTIPTPMRWRYIGVHFAHLANDITRITFRVDGSTTTADVTTPALTGDFAPHLMATAYAVVDWSNLSVWFSPTAPTTWTGETHTSQASLDAGRNELTHLPDVTNADSWNLIQDVAGAELGLVGFDEWGVFYFRERPDPVPAANAQTIAAERGLLGAAATTDIDSLRNIVATKVRPAIAEGTVTIFEPERVDQFDSGYGTTNYYIPLPWGVVGSSLDRVELGRYAVGSWNDDSFSGYVPVDAANPGTELPSTALKVWWSVLPGGRFGKLTVRNLSAYTVRFAHPTTLQPALRVSAYQLVDAPTQTVQTTDAASVAAHGPRILTLPESSWRQVPAPMQELTTVLTGTLASSRAVFEVSAIGDPQRRVGDTVILSDPGGQGTVTGLIVAITRRYSDRGLIDDLTVRATE